MFIFTEKFELLNAILLEIDIGQSLSHGNDV